MSKRCDNCSSRIDTQFVENEILTIPYAAHQSAAARQERQIRRMWIALIVSVVVLFASNMGWLIYESQVDHSVDVPCSEQVKNEK